MNPLIVPKILVTGATGNNGSELIKRLSGAAIPVRGMVRKQPDASYNAPPNVEFITADFADGGSIRRALEGVERAFLVTNSSERVQEHQLRFVEEARDRLCVACFLAISDAISEVEECELHIFLPFHLTSVIKEN